MLAVTVFTQFIMNIWSLPLKLLSIGLSTALGSLQMAEQSRIHNSENWVGDRVRSALETPYLLYFSHFTVHEKKTREDQ